MEKEGKISMEPSEKMGYLLQKEILTFEEGCIYLGRSASSMYKLTSGRMIPYYVPTGKLIYFKRSELDTWALQHKRKSKEEIGTDIENFLSAKTNKRQKN